MGRFVSSCLTRNDRDGRLTVYCLIPIDRSCIFDSYTKVLWGKRKRRAGTQYSSAGGAPGCLRVKEVVTGLGGEYSVGI